MRCGPPFYTFFSYTTLFRSLDSIRVVTRHGEWYYGTHPARRHGDAVGGDRNTDCDRHGVVVEPLHHITSEDIQRVRKHERWWARLDLYQTVTGRRWARCWLD